MAEIFHTIRCTAKTYTEEEWSEHCRAKAHDGVMFPVVHTTCDRYHWNDHDICLNPEVMTLVLKKGGIGWRVMIMWADCGNGLWSFGIDYATGTGGGGFGVSFADKPYDGTKIDWRTGFTSELECKLTACRAAIARVRDSGYWNSEEGDDKRKLTDRLIKMVEDYMLSINPPKPRYQQLELFPD